MALDQVRMFFDLLTIILIISIPFIILLFLRFSIESLINIIKEKNIKSSDINRIDKMSGREFEIFLKHIFEKLGYKVKLLRGYKDHGADLILIDSKGTKIVVQAKKREQGKVGIEAIGEVLRGKEYYRCHLAMVVTNQHFSEQAKYEAQKFGIILWDRKDLIAKIKNSKISRTPKYKQCVKNRN